MGRFGRFNDIVGGVGFVAGRSILSLDVNHGRSVTVDVRVDVDGSLGGAAIDIRQTYRLPHHGITGRRPGPPDSPHHRAAVNSGMPVSGRRQRTPGNAGFHEREEKRVFRSHLWSSVCPTRGRGRTRLSRILASRRRLRLLSLNWQSMAAAVASCCCYCCCTCDGGEGVTAVAAVGFISRDRP